METYYTVIIPSVPWRFRTEWHPLGRVGPLSVLSRGAFPSEDAAIVWARTHLAGCPYSIRKIDIDPGT